MLRVGLTGGLGSGKSTALARFASLGATVFSADEIGRAMMQPGMPVYSAIVEHFGEMVVTADGSLDRSALARIAFSEEGYKSGRLEELNAIVHPAVIARQTELMDDVAARDANAVAIVESALIFETKYGGEGGWHKRFDRLIFIKASKELRVARFVARAAGGKTLSDEEQHALQAEAQRRIARQSETERNAMNCDYVLMNDGSREQLQAQVDALWPVLKEVGRRPAEL
jgi:dephospho-CoA kinase